MNKTGASGFNEKNTMSKILIPAALAAILLLIAMAGMAINLFFKRSTRIKSCNSKDGCDCTSSCSK